VLAGISRVPSGPERDQGITTPVGIPTTPIVIAAIPIVIAAIPIVIPAVPIVIAAIPIVIPAVSIVILAKAGTQVGNYWVPAFAGTTTAGQLHRQSMHLHHLGP